MKKIILLTSLLFSTWIYASSVITDSAFVHHQILNGIQNASYIFEGEVIHTQSYYNEAQNFIYTSNIIKVFQIWKTGEIVTLNTGEYVEVVTRGGRVENESWEITHELGFTLGQKGMFLCKPLIFESNPNSSVSSQFQFQLEDGLYFDYDYSKHYISTSFSDVNFECIESLYEFIDPNYVADCLGVFPNGFLQTQRYNEFTQVVNQRAASAINGDGTIIYTLENGHTVKRNNKSFFEFDIYLSTSAPNDVYFDISSIRLQYNHLAFGSNVVNNNRITVNPGVIISSLLDYSMPAPADLYYNIIGLGVNSTSNVQNRYKLTTTPEQLMHISIEVIDCDKLPDLKFVFHSDILQYTFYTYTSNASTLSSVNFAYIDADDEENAEMCKMSVQSIFPMVVNGGVGDIVTIKGNYFGSQSGHLRLRNANGGAVFTSFAYLDDYDIIEWVDTIIKFRVPSTTPYYHAMTSLAVPGSGPIFIVSNTFNSIITSQWLKIEYSLSNVSRSTLLGVQSKNRVNLAGIDMIDTKLGYVFEIGPLLRGNLFAFDCINESLEGWICATEVRWGIDTVNTTSASVMDDISTIRYGVTGTTATLGESRIHKDHCDDPNGTDIEYVTDIDIVMSNSTSHMPYWFYDFTRNIDQPAQTYDFMAAILHEMGHAVLHEHVNQPDDIMWYKTNLSNNIIPYWRRRVFFSTPNIDGGSKVVQDSKNVDYSSCLNNSHSIEPLVISNCSVPLSIKNVNIKSDFLLKIYPNPSEASINIEFDLERNTNISLELYTITGEIIFGIKTFDGVVGNNILNIDINNGYKGVLLGRLIIDNKILPFRLIRL
jgi:hypothetical protein